MSEECYIYNTIHLLAINHKKQCVALDALMKRKLVFVYEHVTFLSKLRSQLAKSELLHATKIKINKRTFGFRETKHVHIHSKISITDGSYFTFNYVLLLIKESSAVLTHQLSRVLCKEEYGIAL